MDHSGDVARKIKRGYIGHPWNGRDSVSESTEESNRDKHVFTITTGDGGAFRVTVEDVGYDGLTTDELNLDSYVPDERDPVRPVYEVEPERIATHELRADGALDPVDEAILALRTHPGYGRLLRVYRNARQDWRASAAVRGAASTLGMDERSYCDARLSSNQVQLHWASSSTESLTAAHVELAYLDAEAK